jgi:23S rRNA (uracil1939-C5)-methyltransferase
MEQIVTIEKLVHGGLGLARTEGGVVFVSDALPGETLRIAPDGMLGGQPCARLVAIVEPAATRRSPPCEYFGTCGACDWLHMAYEAQVSIKQGIFIECLQRIGKIDLAIECMVFASPEFEYRQRCQFKIDAGSARAGFYKRKSQEVVSISRCPLLMPELNALLKALPRFVGSLPRDTSQIRAIVGSDGQAASSPQLPSLTMFTAIMRLGSHSFMVSGDSFFQGNRYLAEKLGIWPLDILEGDLCVDLYGGVGFFSIVLGKRFSRGILVDDILPQVKIARLNFENNGLNHFSAVAKSAEDFLSKTAQLPPIDCLIIDPPRAGMSPKVRDAIARILPRTIFSVSCNPATQARDIGFLVTKCGYTIVKAALFDLYPNTHHIETAVVLKK